VTLAGTLATTNGGTGLTSFTANGLVYASSTSALATGSGLVFDGTNLGLGVTPSAWSGLTAIQSLRASLVGLGNNGYFGSNWYFDGTNNKYIASAAASRIDFTAGGMQFQTAPSGTAGNAISFTQSLALGKGTTLVLENGTSSSGTGIAFPATQSASSDANTLDDYEEGTWTPALYFGGNAVGLTYASRFGTYTKIGNLVSATVQISLSANGSSTGEATILGLPFTSNSTQAYTAFLQTDNVSFTGSALIYLPPNSTTLAAYYESTAAVSVPITNSNIPGNATLRVTMVYQSA
jgi:hypothetical protein